MKEKLNNLKEWAVKNPKKVYTYSMIVIILSFVFSILQNLFFPPDFKVEPLVPTLYGKSDGYKMKQQSKENEMGKTVAELQKLKKKMENQSLNAQDSIRLKYLYNQYQTLKNGLQKN
jgi:hypothetical protein